MSRFVVQIFTLFMLVTPLLFVAVLLALTASYLTFATMFAFFFAMRSNFV